jgi:predicted restriction endonuclease
MGERNWNWKGGINIENKRIKASLEYHIWRNEVYRKDNWTCRLCGNKKQIVAHHLKLFSEFPELRFSIDNGITLCRSCHWKIHNQ